MLGLISGSITFVAAISDEVVKVDAMNQIADVSWFIAGLTGLGVALTTWRAWLAKSPKES